MEPKKNPVHDVHRYRPLIFASSLIVSLLLVITAFEWSVMKIDKIPLRIEEASLMYIPLIEQTIREVKEEIPVEKRKLPRPLNPHKIVEVNNDTKIVDEMKQQVVQAKVDAIEIPIEYEPAPIEAIREDTFRVVEHMPMPEGGLQGFYKLLQKNMKYPSQAKRTETQGKVFVEFTVGKEGRITNMKVIQGIGSGCDEEAMRVIALSKWTPGKQRGKPVNVRMVQSIQFKLSN